MDRKNVFYQVMILLELKLIYRNNFWKFNRKKKIDRKKLKIFFKKVNWSALELYTKFTKIIQEKDSKSNKEMWKKRQ